MKKIKKSAMVKVDEHVEMVPVLFTRQSNPAHNGIRFIPLVCVTSLTENYHAVTLPAVEPAPAGQTNE